MTDPPEGDPIRDENNINGRTKENANAEVSNITRNGNNIHNSSRTKETVTASSSSTMENLGEYSDTGSMSMKT